MPITYSSVRPALLLTLGLLLAGCGSRTAPLPPPGVTAAGTIPSDPQASVASKAQAAQQRQMAQREQQLMQQTHPAAPPTQGQP